MSIEPTHTVLPGRRGNPFPDWYERRLLAHKKQNDKKRLVKKAMDILMQKDKKIKDKIDRIIKSLVNPPKPRIIFDDTPYNFEDKKKYTL